MSSMFRLPLAGVVKLIIDPPLITFANIVTFDTNFLHVAKK